MVFNGCQPLVQRCDGNDTSLQSTSLLSQKTSSVKDESKNEEANQNKETDIGSEEVKRKETDESADDTDKEEEAESKETGHISAKSPNALETSMSGPTASSEKTDDPGIRSFCERSLQQR